MDELMKFTMDAINDIVSFKLYDKFDITIPLKDWKFMCQKRWFTNKPTQHEVEVEFGVCGARGASNNEEANKIVRKTIEALRGFIEEDTMLECKKHLDSSKRIIGHMDENGHISFSEAEE